MSITASLLALVALLAAFLLVRRTQKSIKNRPDPKSSTRSLASQPQNTKYHAVSIRVGGKACSAAKEMQGERFLASDAPMFPLTDCDSPKCQCRFVHYKDRRARDDRRNPYRGNVGTGTGNQKVEQRAGRGRRNDSDDSF